MDWDDLSFWKSGEWQAAEERLEDKQYTPKRENIFLPMKLTSFESVKVCVLLQDPYPTPGAATGLPLEHLGVRYPATLKQVFGEYSRDLDCPWPVTGSLRVWAARGVFLWNVYPTCNVGTSMSHQWPEWRMLTQEILERLSQDTSCVFVSLGRVASEMLNKYVQDDDSYKLSFGHPSPRGQSKHRQAFKGCRMFSTINVKLREQGVSTIDWRLPCKV